MINGNCSLFLQRCNERAVRLTEELHPLFTNYNLTYMSDTSTVYTLPEIGTDWLPGLQHCYIIYSVKRSTPEEPKFWTSNGFGYTDYWNCGVFTEQEVIGNIWRYNDGLNAVAIPLTVTALTLLGFKIVINTESLNAFTNRAAGATKMSK